MARVDDLKAMRVGLLGRMETCESDRNYAALVKTMMELLAELDQLEPPDAVDRGTPADEFTRRLKERRLADAKALDRPATG